MCRQTGILPITRGEWGEPVQHDWETEHVVGREIEKEASSGGGGSEWTTISSMKQRFAATARHTVGMPNDSRHSSDFFCGPRRVWNFYIWNEERTPDENRRRVPASFCEAIDFWRPKINASWRYFCLSLFAHARDEIICIQRNAFHQPWIIKLFYYTDSQNNHKSFANSFYFIGFISQGTLSDSECNTRFEVIECF